MCGHSARPLPFGHVRTAIGRGRAHALGTWAIWAAAGFRQLLPADHHFSSAVPEMQCAFLWRSCGKSVGCSAARGDFTSIGRHGYSCVKGLARGLPWQLKACKSLKLRRRLLVNALFYARTCGNSSKNTTLGWCAHESLCSSSLRRRHSTRHPQCAICAGGSCSP